MSGAGDSKTPFYFMMLSVGIDIALNHRIGRERYAGFWAGPGAPDRLDGRRDTTLVVLP